MVGPYSVIGILFENNMGVFCDLFVRNVGLTVNVFFPKIIIIIIIKRIHQKIQLKPKEKKIRYYYHSDAIVI